MTSLRSRWTARAVLGFAALAGLLWLWRADLAHRVSTDVLDLIPAGERSPELALARSLASERQARVALFSLAVPGADGAKRDAAARTFISSLRESSAFAEVVPYRDDAARTALGRKIFEQRFNLLLPGWIEARRREYDATDRSTPWPRWLAEHTARKLEAFLPTTEALAFQDLLPADPLLLTPELAETMRGLENSETAAAAGDHVLLWARTRAAPLGEAGQQPVIDAVAHALGSVRAVAPDAQLQWTSIGRFAAVSRTRIQGELSLLNTISLVAVLAIAVLGLRKLWQTLHLVPVMLGGLLAGWAVTTALFDRVHVLVFVVGSLLGGVAVDYGFYLFIQPALTAGEPYSAKVRRLLKPLLASALTTVLGFSLLLFSELPLIRQLGVFVSAGLLAALGTALLWFAQVATPFAETRALIRIRAQGGARARIVSRAVLVAGALVAVLGPWRLHWRDDIRQLDIPAAELRAEAAAVRAEFGESAGRTIYVTRGADPAEARTALARFQAWHAEAFPGATLGSLGFALPTPGAWFELPARFDELDEFPAALRVALEAHGFDAAGFEPFFAAWTSAATTSRPTYDALVADLTGSLSGPLALLASRSADGCWFISVGAHAPGAEAPRETATVSTSQLESLNQLFSRYRASALRLSSIGLSLVGLSVFALYGFRRGWRIFALPSGSCLFAFGVLGLAGVPLNLFHLLGAFLGVCLSHNYAIFSAENAARQEEPPPSIRLSALTTAASFGVLALSQIPVVAALGVTVTLIVLSALFAVELEPLARRRAAT